MIPVDASTITALSAGTVRLALFVELAFDSGTERYVTAGPDIQWNGFTWTGGGAIQSVDAIGEAAGLEALGWQIVMSGTASARLSQAASAIVVGRRASAWVGVYDAAGALVSTPFLKFQGAVNDMVIEEGPKVSKVTIRVESRLIWLLRAKSTFWTNAEQKRLYPTDDGFKFTDTVNARTLKYGPRV